VAGTQGRALIGDDPGPTSALVLAVSVLIETQAGRRYHAEADRMLCRQHLTGLLGVAPWLNIQARIALAHAAALVGNSAEASALAAEAEHLAGRMTGATLLQRQLAALRRTSPPGARSSNVGPSSLTTAELRVLQFLPTHLSNAEIGDRLYVSRHTIKTQMISIYRKLGTHSRSGAVALAAAAGLLEPHEPATETWIDRPRPA
jgi:LuxR family maltose regulon positive regulatory protein